MLPLGDPLREGRVNFALIVEIEYGNRQHCLWPDALEADDAFTREPPLYRRRRGGNGEHGIRETCELEVVLEDLLLLITS